MELKKCLKVSYYGTLRYIIYDVGSHYEDILKLVIQSFEIPVEHRQSLVVVNEHGYIFEKQLFEYFILLFPSPEITFYIRLDRNKIDQCNRVTAQPDADETRVPFAYSKRNNKRSRYDDDETHAYQAVPVHRQNCFMGEMPSSSTGAFHRNDSQGMTQTAGVLRRHNSEDFSKPLAKRIRLMVSVPKKARTLLKRPLRI